MRVSVVVRMLAYVQSVGCLFLRVVDEMKWY